MSVVPGDAVVETRPSLLPTPSAAPVGDMDFDDAHEGEDGDAAPGMYGTSGEERADSDPPARH